MDVFTKGIQNVGIFLFMCGCLHAVTITPLPYKENRQPKQQIRGNFHVKGLAKITIDDKLVTGFEPGYRIPRGTATFLDQDEGVRIRRQMLSDRGTPGFWGGNEDRRDGYNGRRSFNNYDENRYYGNEIDRDTFYDRKSNEFLYYPNYNPEPSSSNRRDYECDPRGRPYNGNQGSSGFNGRRGYDNNGYGGYNGSGGRGGGGGGGGGGRRDYDDRDFGGYNGNRGRRYDDRNQYQPRQDGNRGDGYTGDQWSGRGGQSGGNHWGGKGSSNGRDRDDSIGEGTVGFYGRARRP